MFCRNDANCYNYGFDEYIPITLTKRDLLVISVHYTEGKHEGHGWIVKLVTWSAYHVPDIREDSTELKVAFEMELAVHRHLVY